MSVQIGQSASAHTNVHGATLSDVAKAVSQMDEAGKAEWFPSYRLSSDGSSVAVTVATKITMPRWGEYPSASQADKDEWDRFYAALQAHEEGHIDLVRQQMSGLDEQMTGQSAADARQVWSSALQQLQAASDSYDVDTDHGRKQGTTFDLSGGTTVFQPDAQSEIVPDSQPEVSTDPSSSLDVDTDTQSTPGSIDEGATGAPQPL